VSDDLSVGGAAIVECPLPIPHADRRARQTPSSVTATTADGTTQTETAQVVEDTRNGLLGLFDGKRPR
jgi:hypothetical protein